MIFQLCKTRASFIYLLKIRSKNFVTFPILQFPKYNFDTKT